MVPGILYNPEHNVYTPLLWPHLLLQQYIATKVRLNHASHQSARSVPAVWSIFDNNGYPLLYNSVTLKLFDVVRRFTTVLLTQR